MVRAQSQEVREIPGSTTKPNGPAAAAILAAAIGIFATGLLTTLAEVSTGLRGFLTWWAPAGPLTGKTGLAVILWLVTWGVLGSQYRGKDVNLDKIIRWSWILILLGLLGTFPPFFEAFDQ